MTQPSEPLSAFNSLLAAVVPTSTEGIVVVAGILTLTAYTFWQVRQQHTALSTYAIHLETLNESTTPLDEQTLLSRLPGQGAFGKMLQTALAHLQSVRQLPGLDPQIALAGLPLLLERYLGQLRQRPNQLMLLGLLGTVLGLSLTIGEFAPQLRDSLRLLSSGDSPDALNEGVGQLLDQMKVAFVCTLWGVASSLAVTRFALVPLIARRDQLQQELEQFVIFRMTPLAWSGAVRREEALLQAFERNREGLERIHQTLAAQLDVFRTQTQLAAQSLKAAGDNLSSIGLQATEAALGTAKASDQATRILQQMGTTLVNSEEQLSRATETLHHNVTALNTQQTAYETTQAHVMQVTAAHAQDLAALVTSFGEGSSRLLDGLQANLDTFEAARAELVGHTTQVVGAQQEVGRAFTQAASGLFDDVRRVLHDHQVTAQSINDELGRVAQALEPLEVLTQRLDPQLLPVERWSAFQQALEDIATRWDGWQSSFSQRLSRLLDDSSGSLLVETRQQASEVQRQLSATTDTITTSLRDALTRWDAVYADLAQHTAGTLHGQMSIADQLQRDHDELRRDLRRVARSLEDLIPHLARVDEAVSGLEPPAHTVGRAGRTEPVAQAGQVSEAQARSRQIPETWTKR